MEGVVIVGGSAVEATWARALERELGEGAGRGRGLYVSLYVRMRYFSENQSSSTLKKAKFSPDLRHFNGNRGS